MEETTDEVKKDPRKVIHQKLVDIVHTQQSAVEKIGQVKVDLLNHPDKELEKELGDMMTRITENHDKLKTIAVRYEGYLE